MSTLEQETELFSYININDYLNAYNESEIGENELLKILSDFVCTKNVDVENFLKNNAINFAKKNQSITYLVFTNDDATLVGYFTIALKPLIINCKSVSNTTKKKLGRISDIDEETQSYMMSAYLIAQLGKNYNSNVNFSISGDELLSLALQVIEEIRYSVGGMVTFLEAEPLDKLLQFYEKDINGFKVFNKRTSKGNSDEHELVQLLKIL